MRRWQDWASFAAALWLAVSPWLLGYATHDVATANAAVMGLGLAVSAHVSCSCDYSTSKWLGLGGGTWLVVAPFVLGFDDHPLAAVHCTAVGALIVALSAWALELDREIGRLWHKVIAGH